MLAGLHVTVWYLAGIVPCARCTDSLCVCVCCCTLAVVLLQSTKPHEHFLMGPFYTTGAQQQQQWQQH
jgi:hypothetical protein